MLYYGMRCANSESECLFGAGNSKHATKNRETKEPIGFSSKLSAGMFLFGLVFSYVV